MHLVELPQLNISVMLLRRGVEGSGSKMPLSPRTYLDAAAPSKAIASLLRPPVVEFLKRAYVEYPLLPGRGALFQFLEDLAGPSSMLDVYVGCVNEAPPRMFIRLYMLSDFRSGDNEVILLNQHPMKASFITDYNDTPGICALPFMIDEGKVEAVTDDRTYYLTAKLDSRRVDRPWVIHQYTAADVAMAVAALKRLQNVLPPSTFAHEFLTAIAHIKVRSRYVAPGLRFPIVSEFLYYPVTGFKKSPATIRPGTAAMLQQWMPLCTTLRDWNEKTRAEIKRGTFGRGNMDHEPDPHNEHAGLHQSGLSDGFSEDHDVQIDKVLRNWAERVERGNWDVDRDGVMGGIEKFREADTEEH
ncbi:hypothetical protein BDW67DRAFT_176795 [Aspergillus spinulosporus]